MQGKTKKNKKSIYLVLIAVVVAIALLRTFVIDWTAVSGNSMAPTLLNNELAVAEKTIRITREVTHGDIVILNLPNGVHAVKRIIALGGDEVSVLGGTLFVNGENISKAYSYEALKSDMKALIVPKNTVFVIGDNVNNSLDSRSSDIGCVPQKDILGRVFLVVYPFNKFRVI